MGPVHAVLANSDLLTMIFPAKAESYYQRKRLLRFALVCRKFNAVALDILWKTVYNMNQIYCLFPEDVLSTGPENPKLAFNRAPVTREQWARFENYAWRVRTIYVTLPEDHDVYMVLGRHPSRRHPFPHLTCLQWFSDVYDVSHATLMICSTLVDIFFYLRGMGPDAATTDTIQAVRETCTHLREFEYSLDGEFIPSSTAFETSLDSLIRSAPYLRKVSIPTNCRVLDALGGLPSLTRLSLGQPSESDENGWNVTYPVVSQSPNQGTFFVALELVDIWSTFPSINSMHQFLQPFGKMASKPRVHLRVRIDTRESRSLTENPRDLYNALPPKMRIGLEGFSIYQHLGFDIIPSVHPWQSFSWLLGSPHLQILGLQDHLLEIDDTAFTQMVQKLPELRILDLVPSDISVHPLTTFRGLAHLSLLSKLQHLYITIGPNCAIEPSLLYGEQVSTSPLHHLDLRGEFPNADTLQVALFLTKHFPNLQTLQTPREQPQPQWDEVNARVRFLSKVLPEITNSRVWLSSGR